MHRYCRLNTLPALRSSERSGERIRRSEVRLQKRIHKIGVAMAIDAGFFGCLFLAMIFLMGIFK